jgi:hypothetical protein
MRTSVYNTLFTIINQASAGRKTSGKIRYSYDALLLVECLKRNKLIYGYHIDSLRTNIVIFFVLSFNTPLVRHLIIYSSKKRVLEISLIELMKFQNRTKSNISPVLLLLTSQGYMTHPEAIKLGLSGRLVGRFLI